MIKNKKLFIILIILAVVLRVFLMVSTYHSDLAGQILSTYFFAYKGVVNIYDHLLTLGPDHPLVRNFGVGDIFIYPPLTYFTLGGFLKLLQSITSESFFTAVMNGEIVYKIKDFGYYLFLLKLPYLLVDLLLAFFLTKLFDNPNQKRIVFLLWLFNPVTLYSSFAMGVFDIIPTFFTVLSLVSLARRKPLLAAAMLGVAAAYKTYPLFLLPLLILSQKNLWQKIKAAVAGFLPYVLSLAPFWSSPAFRNMVFGPKSQKQFFMIWPVSGAEGIYPFMFLYALLALLVSRTNEASKKMYRYFLAFFLLLFSLTHYHPQWFIWMTPFFLIELVSNRFRNIWLVLTLLACFIYITLTFENSLSVGLFAPLVSQAADFVGFAKLIGQKTDFNFARSLVRSVSAGVSLYYAYDLLASKEKNVS